MITDSNRGTGRTTQQMKDAPQHAVFVVCVPEIHYARRLARALKREDLLVIDAQRIEDRLQGCRCQVIVDHALQSNLSAQHANFINYHNLRVAQLKDKR